MKKLLISALTASLMLTACNSDKTEVTVNEDGTATLNSKGVEYGMTLVPAGEFKMGATTEMQQVNGFEESPSHDVVITKDYYLGNTEVTQELWEAVMDGQNPSSIKDGQKNLPVVNVSWNDCQKFIKKLNQLTGKTFRLPTEAEWEYAARGGAKSNHLQYSGSIYIERVAWYRSTSDFKLHPTGLLDKNELGFHDMSGNVWEWCQDGHVQYTDKKQTDPCGQADSTQTYVIRGGAWDSGQSDCRYTSRLGFTGKDNNANIGLRLAMSK